MSKRTPTFKEIYRQAVKKLNNGLQLNEQEYRLVKKHYKVPQYQRPDGVD